MQALVISVVLLWLLVLVLLVLVVLLYRQFGLLYLGSGQRVRMTGRPVGKHAVEGLTVELEGTEVALDWSRPGEGRGTLLVLGGPICPLCAELVPQLNDRGSAAEAPTGPRIYALTSNNARGSTHTACIEGPGNPLVN